LGVVRGSVPAISKLVTLGGVDPVIYAGSIALFGGLLLLVATLVVGRAIPLTTKILKFSIVGGFIGIALPHVIFFNGIKSVDVGVASAMISGIPIIIYVLSLLFRQEIFAVMRFGGVLLGVVGVGLMALSELTGNAFINASSLGLAMILISTFFYAANVIYITMCLPEKLPRMQAAALMMIFGSLPVWLYILIGYDSSVIISNVTSAAFNYVLVHCLISGIAYWLSFHIISSYGPVIYSVAANLMVVFGMTIGVLAFDESYTGFDILGVVLIIIGVVLVTLKKHQKATEPRLEPPQT
jgi:drug/metabolite transporter (DMT)-like permease